MKEEKLELLHYKNAIFQGYISSGKKQGQAICLFDNRAIFIGKFQNDQYCDECVLMLTPETYFMGTFKKGMLDGPFIIRSPRYHLYSQTIMNRIIGQIVVVDRVQRRARVWQIQSSEGVCIREGDYDEFHSEQKILRAIAPYTKMFPNLLQYFVLNISNRFSIQTSKGKEKLEISMQIKSNRKLTLQFDRERLIAAGVMQNGSINGIGYLYDSNSQIQIQGQIQNSVLHGQGVKRQLTTGRTIFGKFSRGDIRSLDVFTQKQQPADSSLGKLKKKIHIHSLQFNNDYLNQRSIYLLRNFYDSVIQNESTYNKFQKDRIYKSQGRQKSEVSMNRDMSNDELSSNINEYNLIKSALNTRR